MSTRSKRSLKRRRKLSKRNSNTRVIIHYRPGVKSLIDKLDDVNISLEERLRVHSELYDENGNLKTNLYIKKVIKF
jgi:hypothetical protein